MLPQEALYVGRDALIGAHLSTAVILSVARDPKLALRMTGLPELNM